MERVSKDTGKTGKGKEKDEIFSSLGSDNILIVNGHKYRTDEKVVFNTEL